MAISLRTTPAMSPFGWTAATAASKAVAIRSRIISSAAAFTLLNDGNMSVEDYNVILSSASIGARVVRMTSRVHRQYVGGTEPMTLAGWQLAANSLGIKAASDGTNIGVPAEAAGAATTTTPPSNSDTTPPTVSLTAPANNATVSGTTTISATASDNVKISSVQFQLDGKNLGLALTAPASGSTYSYAWNTAGVSNGSHTLTAIATDSSNNAATSAVAHTATPHHYTVSC